MKNMHAFYASLPQGSSIHKSRFEYARLLRIFQEEPTNGEEIPEFFRAITRLRSDLEDLKEKPEIVKAFIGVLDSEFSMMRAVIDSLKKPID